MQQMASFSSNHLLETSNSLLSNNTEGMTRKLDSLRRKCSDQQYQSPIQGDNDLNQFHAGNSFQEMIQPQVAVHIDRFFKETKSRPKYTEIQILSWEREGEACNNKSEEGTHFEDEDPNQRKKESIVEENDEETILYSIRFKRSKDISIYVIKRTLNDLLLLRSYYKLIYETYDFPNIEAESTSLNRDKDSFRSDGNCEEIIHCGNIFFEFIMKNSMFSLNLRKFLEEGCEFFDPSADQHGIFIQEEQQLAA